MSDDITPDIHGSVVKLCDQLCSLIPDADKVNARAIDVNGNELRFGDSPPIASNSIPRNNLPAKALQRWNQIFISLVLNRSAANTETEYAEHVKDLLIRCNKEFKGYLDAWCRDKDKKYCKTHVDEIEAVAIESNQFSLNRVSSVNVGHSPVKDGVNISEPVSALIAGICGNLIPRLYRQEGNYTALAAFSSDLLNQSKNVLGASFWKYLDSLPKKEITELQQNIDYLRAVLGECGVNSTFIDTVHAKAKRSARGNALRLCAIHAGNMAEKRLLKEKESISKMLSEKGFTVSIFDAPAEKDDGWLWPATDFVITVSLDNLVSYFECVEDILKDVNKKKCTGRRAYLVPVIQGYCIWQFAFSFLSGQPFPAIDDREDVKQNVDPTKYQGALLQTFDKALEALVKLSAVLNIRDINKLRSDEVDAFNSAFEAYEEHYKELNDTLENFSDEKLEDAVSLLSELANTVQQQQDQKSKNEFCPNPARAQYNTLRGEMDNVTSYILATRIGLIEYGLDRME